ncbi:MAG: hypothetical protein AAF266_08900 [Planctomycetota bacterium]
MCCRTASFLALLAAGLMATPAAAHPEYQRGFQTVYTKGPDIDKDFRKLVRKAKCNLCHQGKKDRTKYNRYGTELLDHLADGDKKNKEKIATALAAVADLPSDGDGSPTYADLIAAGSLPGGPLKASQVEPPDAAD